MEKVVLDSNRCIGCGACVAIAGETFEFGDDNCSQVKNDTVTDQVREVVDNAMCPVDAISIVNEEAADNTEDSTN